MNRKFAWAGALLIFLITTAFVAPTEQLIKTQLRITVLNDLGSVVEGASVTLYPTLEDYRNDTNPVQATKTTDSRGRVAFKPLEPTTYFVDVKMGDLSNVGLAVQTDTLKEAFINKVNIIIQ